MLNPIAKFYPFVRSVSLFVVLLLHVTDASTAPLFQDTVSVAEPTLRKLATSIVVPTYPSKGIKQRRQGRVVIRILIDEHGKLSRVTPIETPDDTFLNSVISAVKLWRWGAATHGPDRSQQGLTAN